ncbi:MAG TPA: hypothetical protein VFU15_14825 [Bacteroidia bacterium]|nr:hypothetical protein [Bacteroidia bacterium]
MLEFSQHILKSVSFDKSLFRKELSKMLKWVKPDEALLLKAWCIATFGHMYGDVIRDVYRSVTKT